jgi:hypothetical protein
MADMTLMKDVFNRILSPSYIADMPSITDAAIRFFPSLPFAPQFKQ